MKTAILVGLAALAVIGLGVGVVAAQSIASPHTTAGGMQGGNPGGMMGGHGGMMGGSYGGCGCANDPSCQDHMYDHNYSWDRNGSYGGMMG
jgi:hypothetical protein